MIIFPKFRVILLKERSICFTPRRNSSLWKKNLIHSKKNSPLFLFKKNSWIKTKFPGKNPLVVSVSLIFLLLHSFDRIGKIIFLSEMFFSCVCVRVSERVCPRIVVKKKNLNFFVSFIALKSRGIISKRKRGSIQRKSNYFSPLSNYIFSRVFLSVRVEQNVSIKSLEKKWEKKRVVRPLLFFKFAGNPEDF